MTILELQKELQEMYEKYGDIEVAIPKTETMAENTPNENGLFLS